MFDETLYYMIIYLVFNIAILRYFKSKHIKTFSLVFQMLVFYGIITDYNNYESVTLFLREILTVTILMFFTGLEIKNNRGE